VLSVNTLNEYVEPVTELFSKYSKGNIYFSSFGKDDHNRTKIELSIEGNIPNSEIEYISIGVKLLKHLDPNIDINIQLLTEEMLSTYFNNSYESLTIGSIMIHPESEKNNIDTSYSNMIVKPGLGFGTGKHPTTKMCLLELQQIKNKTVLDIGTGSGILSIAATFFGASKCIGIDSDDMALSNANYNVRLNKLNEKIDLIQSDFENYNTSLLFDTIYVNVSKLFLLNNLKTIYKMLHLNGNLIISGFKTEDENQITSIYSDLFNIVSTKLEAGWACVRMVKNEAK
tara:strand:- start:7314 stop:8168 length:855 start_codon:yes stop_codon:yes gene_type:complete